jgi:cysteine desulfuration protein SufE
MAETATIAEAEDLIAEEFALFDEPREKYEYIIDLGKRLPPLPDAQKTAANKVSGCQSQVWMVGELDPASGRLRLLADSDAVIVKGLIALLMRLYSDRPPAEILATPPSVFEKVGLGKLLTPGRSNGLYSMVKRIRELAAAAEAARLVEAG